MGSDRASTSSDLEPQAEEAAHVVAQARRFVEDLIAFEGPRFLVPESVFRSHASCATDSGAVVPTATAATATAATATAATATAALEAFRHEICECTKCALGTSRRQFVFGCGSAEAGIMFVGEAPGAEEDRQGIPFVGAAGQLLTKIIEAMQLQRDEVFICNVLKCRPPGNRNPLPEEISTCEPYLRKQIEIVSPRIICALGRVAAHLLLQTTLPMHQLRGRLHQYEGIPVLVTYHPSYLLRNPGAKRDAWEDVKRLRREFDGMEL